MSKTNQIDRGEIVKLAVEASGKKKNNVAEALNITTQTLRNYFKTSDLSWDIIRAIGTVIQHDFSNQFPSMPIEIPANQVNEEHELYLHRTQFASLQACSNEYEYIFKKYVNLLEQYQEIESENRRYRNKYGIISRFSCF